VGRQKQYARFEAHLRRLGGDARQRGNGWKYV
jgi:hypothetical protein